MWLRLHAHGVGTHADHAAPLNEPGGIVYYGGLLFIQIHLGHRRHILGHGGRCGTLGHRRTGGLDGAECGADLYTLRNHPVQQFIGHMIRGHMGKLWDPGVQQPGHQSGIQHMGGTPDPTFPCGVCDGFEFFHR